MHSFLKPTWVIRSILANSSWGIDWTLKYPQMFVCSTSEAHSLIFAVYLLYNMFKALFPLKSCCFWEYVFLLQITHITQLSKLLGNTNLVKLPERSVTKVDADFGQYLSALCIKLDFFFCSLLPHLLTTFQTLQYMKHPCSVLNKDLLKAASKYRYATVWACN